MNEKEILKSPNIKTGTTSCITIFNFIVIDYKYRKKGAILCQKN